jgi:hypothetical protein
VAVEKKASAQNIAAGAALIFKSCFVFISSLSVRVFCGSRESR